MDGMQLDEDWEANFIDLEFLTWSFRESCGIQTLAPWRCTRSRQAGLDVRGTTDKFENRLEENGHAQQSQAIDEYASVTQEATGPMKAMVHGDV
jgi:hypothetical protein